jgi:hypothetical protein
MRVECRILVLVRWRNTALDPVVHVAFMEQLVCIFSMHVHSQLPLLQVRKELTF